MRKRTLTVLIGCVLGHSWIALAQQSLWLDELDYSQVLIDWGAPRINRSVGNHALAIGAETFERGIGTHAESEFTFKLDGRASRLSAWVGVDREVRAQAGDPSRASVEFVVIADDRQIFQSGIMTAETPAKAVDLDLDGVKCLQLVVTNGGDGIHSDHADWCRACIDYHGQRPELLLPKRPEPYLLTPPPGPKPRITGPRVFAARPGNPFLFTLTATGTRPMTFEVQGLPEGLTLDSQSGRITGTVKTAGTYPTTITATNQIGRTKRVWSIVIGEDLCLTPPMGWNSWNCWAHAVDDEKVRAAAQAMVDTGLIQHGWSYINIDDCWMRKPDSNDPIIGGPVRDQDGRILCNDKFPDMKALTDYIHDLGLKAGIYISPGPTTCQGYEGSWQHEHIDALQFAQWGFDYLKYDWCGYSKVSGHQQLEDLQRPYILMGDILRQMDRDIVYSLCQYGWGEVWTWGQEVGGHCYRTTGDIYDKWSSMAGIGFRQADLYPYAGPGHWNDPDMLVVGKVGWGPNLHESRLTPDEQYTHMSLWCLLSAPLLIGCPIEQMDAFTLNLLTNDEVLEVDQDPLGQQARRVSDEHQKQVWVKDMADGSKVVGLFNLNAYVDQDVTVSWENLGLKGEQRVRDLWRQKDLGRFDHSFSARVRSHGVILVQLFKQ